MRFFFFQWKQGSQTGYSRYNNIFLSTNVTIFVQKSWWWFPKADILERLALEAAIQAGEGGEEQVLME